MTDTRGFRELRQLLARTQEKSITDIGGLSIYEPDSIVLMDGATTLDAVGYGSFAASEIFAGEGIPAPDAPAGSSLARLFADIDSDDNAADFIVLATPTPGEAQWSSVPEPSSALLLMIGLMGLDRWRRSELF